jgi:hypothetical protein
MGERNPDSSLGDLRVETSDLALQERNETSLLNSEIGRLRKDMVPCINLA